MIFGSLTVFLDLAKFNHRRSVSALEPGGVRREAQPTHFLPAG
jgi:hypothetical protein